MIHWQEYVRAAYDLIIESEGLSATFLDHEVEAYVVHLFAKNFNRKDIGQTPIAIQMLMAESKYQPIADECLLIDSFPLKKKHWPTETYYRDMGQIAYGLANIEIMEKNFNAASKVLSTVFRRMI